MIILIFLFQPTTFSRDANLMTESITTRHFLLFFILPMIFLGAVTSEARLVDKVVAVVNGEVITQTELDKAGKEIFTKIRQSFPAYVLDEKMAEARQEILDNLIDDILVRQRADELRLDTTDEDVDHAITRISKDNKITVEELYMELERTGIDKEEYRRKLAKQILQSKLINYEVQSKVVISENRAREYYENVYTKQETPQGYHLLQIGIPWETSEQAPLDAKERAKQKAEEIRKLAVAGREFRELAQSFSGLPSAKDGGDIGFFRENEMAGPMRAIITTLEPGQISEVIDVGDSYQFYRLVARNLDGKPKFAPFEDVKAEIIDLLRQEELDERYKKWLKEIKEQAIIKKIN